MAKDETINDILKSINLPNGQEEESRSQIRNLLDAEIEIHKAEYGENTESTISNNLRIDLLVSQFLINKGIKVVSEISEISHEQLMKEQTSLMKNETQRNELLPIMNGTNKIDVSSEVFNSVLQFHYRGIGQDYPTNTTQGDVNLHMVKRSRAILEQENAFQPSEDYKDKLNELRQILPQGEDGDKLLGMLEEVARNQLYGNYMNSDKEEINGYSEDRLFQLQGVFLELSNKLKNSNKQSLSTADVLSVIKYYNQTLSDVNYAVLGETEIDVLSERIAFMNIAIDQLSSTQSSDTVVQQLNDEQLTAETEETPTLETPEPRTPETPTLETPEPITPETPTPEIPETPETPTPEIPEPGTESDTQQWQEWDAEIKQMEEQFAQDETARQSYEEVREKLLSLLPKDNNGEIDPELVQAVDGIIRSQTYATILDGLKNNERKDYLEIANATADNIADNINGLDETTTIISVLMKVNDASYVLAKEQELQGIDTLADRIVVNEEALIRAREGFRMRKNADELQKLDKTIKQHEEDLDPRADNPLKTTMILLDNLDFQNEKGETDKDINSLLYELAQNETYVQCMRDFNDCKLKKVDDLTLEYYKNKLNLNLECLLHELVTNQVLFEELGDDVTKLSKEGLQQKLQTIKQQASQEDISQKIQKRLDAFRHGEKIVISPQTSAVTFAVHNHELKKYAENLQKNTGIKSLIKRVRDFDAKMTEKYPKLYPIAKNGLETGGAALLLGPAGLALVSARKTYKSYMKIKQDAQKAGKGFFEYLGDNKAIAAGLGMQVLGSVVSAYTGIDASVVGNLGIIHQGVKAVNATLGTKIARTGLSSLGAALAQSGINDDLKNKQYWKAAKKIGKTAATAAVGLFIGEHAGEAVGWLKEHWPFGHNATSLDVSEQPNVSTQTPTQQEAVATVPEAENLTPPDLGVDALGNKIPFTDADGNVIYQGMPEGWHPPFAADQTLASADASDPSASEPEPEAKTPSEGKETAKVQQSQSSSEAAKETPASASDPSASESEAEAKAPSEGKETAKVQQSQSSSEAAKETPASSEGETPADKNTEKDAATDTTTDQPVVADEDLQSKSLLANMPKGYSTGESVDVKDENNIVIGQSYPILDENGDKVADVEASLWKDDIRIISEHHTDGTTIQTTIDGNNVALLAEFDKDNNLTDLDGNLRQTTEGGLKYAFAYSDEPVYCGNTVSSESLNAVMPNSIDTPQGQVLIDSYGYPISAEHAQERLSDIVAKHEIYNDLLARQTNGDGLSAEETSFMTNHQQDLEREGLEDKDGQLVRTEKMPNSEMRNNMYNQFLDRQKQGLELTPQQQQFIEYHEKLLQQNSEPSTTPPETVADKVSALRGTNNPNNPTSHPDYSKLADHQADPQKDFGLPKSNDPLSRIQELRSQSAGSGHHIPPSDGKTTGNSR